MAIIINKDTLPDGTKRSEGPPKRNKDTRSVEEIRKARNTEKNIQKSVEITQHVHHVHNVEAPASVSLIFDVQPQKSDTINYVKAEPRKMSDKSDQYIVVNGQKKRIGKHSHYLVDMFTTEH